MNSESEQKLSMDELLHRNMPANIPPMRSQPTPTMITAEQWNNLIMVMNEICDSVNALQTAIQRKALPTSYQMDELNQQLKQLTETLKKPEPAQPAGKKHARHISMPSIHLPPISLLLMLPLSLLVLAGLWLFLFGPLSAMTILP